MNPMDYNPNGGYAMDLLVYISTHRHLRPRYFFHCRELMVQPRIPLDF